jgi:hypothetical protein
MVLRTEQQEELSNYTPQKLLAEWETMHGTEIVLEAIDRK